MTRGRRRTRSWGSAGPAYPRWGTSPWCWRSCCPFLRGSVSRGGHPACCSGTRKRTVTRRRKTAESGPGEEEWETEGETSPKARLRRPRRCLGRFYSTTPRQGNVITKVGAVRSRRYVSFHFSFFFFLQSFVFSKGEVGEEGEDCAFGDTPPASRLENGASSVKHSSSVDNLKKRRSFCERRLQMRHSCTGENASFSDHR